ncbi:hypothetical protein FGO68_gene3076 [Halteria grandinella]|uniref:Uncharacterized protein n=1 Tax=Halteria grandinella TaxID=5974 RepID=A0A8J8NST1_HALGN|nr:hypothetical protein FGO68_gene3076 [Halteria grandinella]
MLQELIEELDKGKVRVQESRKEIFGRIDALIGELTTAKSNIEKQLSAEETQQQMTVAAQLNQLPKKGQDTLKRVINTNKTYYENLSKFGKFVAKEFPPKPEYEEPFFKDYIIDKSALNQTIAEHMFRSGFNQAGDTFTKEVIGQLGQEDEEQLVSEEFKAKFKTLNLIVKEMRNGVLSGAKAWAREHTQQLGELGSDLLYAMVKSEFLIMLQQGKELSQIHDGGADIKMEDASEQGW